MLWPLQSNYALSLFLAKFAFGLRYALAPLFVCALHHCPWAQLCTLDPTKVWHHSLFIHSSIARRLSSALLTPPESSTTLLMQSLSARGLSSALLTHQSLTPLFVDALPLYPWAQLCTLDPPKVWHYSLLMHSSIARGLSSALFTPPKSDTTLC
jgi:hypothetical protein